MLGSLLQKSSTAFRAISSVLSLLGIDFILWDLLTCTSSFAVHIQLSMHVHLCRFSSDMDLSIMNLLSYPWDLCLIIIVNDHEQRTSFSIVRCSTWLRLCRCWTWLQFFCTIWPSQEMRTFISVLLSKSAGRWLEQFPSLTSRSRPFWRKGAKIHPLLCSLC